MSVTREDDARLSPRLMGRFIAILATTCILTTAQAQTIPAWNLVWADEFTQADGTPPDPANWGYDIGGWGWGNNEWQYYTSRTNNARIVNNQLVIEAHEESFGGRNYTSARLLTQNKWSWTYGRLEARIKVPYGQGIWPAFWMLGTDFPGVPWPDCGELDIMEHIGREPKNVHGTAHGPGYSGGSGIGGSYAFVPDLSDDFHVFAVEWEANRIKWYVDGIHYFTITSRLGGLTWVFDHPFFFILNVAVGGNWPGYPDGTTVFPQQMLVDYVRVYTPFAVVPFSVDAALVGNDIQISFPTQNGADYQVSYKASTADPNWTPIETIAGDGTTKTVSYPATDPVRFYTVQMPLTYPPL